MKVLLEGLVRNYPENASIQYLLANDVTLNFVLLGYITEAFDELGPEQFHPHLVGLLEGLAFFHQKYSRIEDRKSRVRTFHQDVDNVISKDLFGKAGLADSLKCMKGCSGCCSQVVTITPSEGELLIHEVPEASKQRLKKQTGLTVDNWMNELTEDEGKCVFLNAQDGACLVWENRPANCRNYFVSGSSEFCSVFHRDPERSRSIKSIYADICISAFYSLEGKEMTLSTYLFENCS